MNEITKMDLKGWFFVRNNICNSLNLELADLKEQSKIVLNEY
jgi:hypothetical protein